MHAVEMRLEFGGDRVDASGSGAPESSNWPPGSSEIAPPPSGVVEADQLAVVLDRRPTEARLGPFEQRPYPALAVVGNRRAIGGVEGEFFVLDADTERFGRLAARRQPSHQFVAGFDDLSVDDVAGHSGFSRVKLAGRPACDP